MSMEKEIARAVWELIEPKIDKKLAAMEKRILSALEPMQQDSLLKISEAADKIGVSQNTLRDLAKAGEIVMIAPPGQRAKILESSIYDYFRRLQQAG